MIGAMPRPRPKYLHRQISRHGKTVWYVRVGRGKRVRLNAEFGTPEFDVQYNAALAGEKPSLIGEPAKNTLGWLIARYRDSSAWGDLSDATRKQRECILKQVISAAGNEPISAIDAPTIERGKERRKKVPFQARHYLATMRGLFRWAIGAGHTEKDPTLGISITNPDTKGFAVWTEDELAQYEATWPRGTRERVMFDIFLYTGLRRGDAARLGRPHVRKGVITIDTEKTGRRVTIPVRPELARTLEAGPCGEMTFIASLKGQPMCKEAVGELFRVARLKAGIVGKSAHGIRKAAATRAAHQGASVPELNALFGWDDAKMALHYTREADRAKLARGAVRKLARPKS